LPQPWQGSVGPGSGGASGGAGAGAVSIAASDTGVPQNPFQNGATELTTKTPRHEDAQRKQTVFIVRLGAFVSWW
jgi:hypothetical protein